jgi:hypothetical protein
MIPQRMRLARIAMVACVCLAAARSASAQSVQRYAERPPAQAGSSGSSSWMTRQFVFEGPSPRLEFDYFVDCAFFFDYLQVSIDGASQFVMSGRNQVGKAVIPVSAGAHTVKLEYFKSGGAQAGLDTAWVDNLAIVNEDGPRYLEPFHQQVPGAPSGWTAGGGSGGWVVAAPRLPLSVGRPLGQAFTSYQPEPTTSWIERAVSFSSEGTISFNYFVDSEEGYDLLRLRRNGAIIFEASGSYKGGKKIIKVPAGAHTFRFEYYKDWSVDGDLDVARISEIVFKIDDFVLEADYFDGQTPGNTPSQWTGGGADGGWVVTLPAPPRVFVAPDPQTQPITIDGRIDPETSPYKEYRNPTRLVVPDYLGGRQPANVTLQASASSEALFIGHRATSATPTNGSEHGFLFLGFDSNHGETLRGRGSCPDPAAPGPEDRLFQIEYQSSPGQFAVASISTVQHVGDCSSWQVATAPQSWPLSFAGREHSDRPGYLDLEAKVVTRGPDNVVSDLWATEVIGVHLVHVNNELGATNYTWEHLPTAEGIWSGGWPLPIDRWETLLLRGPETPPFDSRVDAVPRDWTL